MKENNEFRGQAQALLDEDEVQGVLSGAFFTPSEPPPTSKTRSKPAAPKPEHYKVICISMYTEDLGRLDAMVEKLKARGLTKANRSALIRYALEQVDLEKVPKGIGLSPRQPGRPQNERMSSGSGASTSRRCPVTG